MHVDAENCANLAILTLEGVVGKMTRRSAGDAICVVREGSAWRALGKGY